MEYTCNLYIDKIYKLPVYNPRGCLTQFHLGRAFFLASLSLSELAKPIHWVESCLQYVCMCVVCRLSVAILPTSQNFQDRFLCRILCLLLFLVKKFQGQGQK